MFIIDQLWFTFHKWFFWTHELLVPAGTFFREEDDGETRTRNLSILILFSMGYFKNTTVWGAIMVPLVTLVLPDDFTSSDHGGTR